MDTGEDEPAVENVTVDLDSFGNMYAGTTKERRLMFIAKRCPALRIEALKTLVALLATGKRPSEHQKFALQLAEASVLAGLEPVAAPTDDAVKAKVAANSATLEKLEADHKKNKVNTYYSYKYIYIYIYICTHTRAHAHTRI